MLQSRPNQVINQLTCRAARRNSVTHSSVKAVSSEREKKCDIEDNKKDALDSRETQISKERMQNRPQIQ